MLCEAQISTKRTRKIRKVSRMIFSQNLVGNFLKIIKFAATALMIKSCCQNVSYETRIARILSLRRRLLHIVNIHTSLQNHQTQIA